MCCSCAFSVCYPDVCADSVCQVPGMNVTMGLDTLEEEEEKASFFAQLEAGSSPIDYSKLNNELDSTTSTSGNYLRYGG